MRTIHGCWNVEPDAVTLIDAHHHLWDLRQNRHPWLCTGEEKEFFLGDYSPRRCDYLPQDYLRDARGHNVLTTADCEAEWDRADQVRCSRNTDPRGICEFRFDISARRPRLRTPSRAHRSCSTTPGFRGTAAKKALSHGAMRWQPSLKSLMSM